MEYNTESLLQNKPICLLELNKLVNIMIDI